MKRIWRLLKRSPPALKFAGVGGIGFLIDTGVLILLFQWIQVDLVYARITAFTVAATANWILNRVFTFADQNLIGRRSMEWIRFIASAILSAIPNLGIFFLLMLILPKTLVYIIFAMCCGILAGYFCNYQLARLWVFQAGELGENST